jgi:hypothetical protein
MIDPVYIYRYWQYQSACFDELGIRRKETQTTYDLIIWSFDEFVVCSFLPSLAGAVCKATVGKCPCSKGTLYM